MHTTLEARRADSMLGDQMMAEVSASGSAYRDCLRFTRPAAARQMRAPSVSSLSSAPPNGTAFGYCRHYRLRRRVRSVRH
jgi:hypothetical protein